MRLKLENICKIHRAELDVNGITVIAGENNTGKSTVGKMLYTVVKSINEWDYYFCDKLRKKSNTIDKALVNYIKNEVREQKSPKKQKKHLFQILNMFEDIIIASKKHVNEIAFDYMFFEIVIQEFIDKSKKIDRILLDMLLVKLINEEIEVVEPSCDKGTIKSFLNRIFNSENYDLVLLLDDNDNEILLNYIEKYGEILNIDMISNLVYKDKIQRVLELSNELEDIIANRNLEMMVSDSFARILKSEFLSGVIEPVSEKKEHIVELENDFNKTCKIRIKEQKVEVSEVNENPIISEVTYIESPTFLYLNYFEVKELKGVSSHITDLIEKLSGEENRIDDSENCNLNEILEGNFSYDGINDNFVYKENSTPYKMTNVANGTKAFGILQMLNEKGWLSPDNILIIDEPEVHLHPKWQVEYCKVISALARQGIRFVITTHSPYIVQAIKKFSGDFGITKDVNFYLSEELEQGVIIQDKTRKLGDIYEKLTAPLREIM